MKEYDLKVNFTFDKYVQCVQFTIEDNKNIDCFKKYGAVFVVKFNDKILNIGDYPKNMIEYIYNNNLDVVVIFYEPRYFRVRYEFCGIKFEVMTVNSYYENDQISYLNTTKEYIIRKEGNRVYIGESFIEYVNGCTPIVKEFDQYKIITNFEIKLFYDFLNMEKYDMCVDTNEKGNNICLSLRPGAHCSIPLLLRNIISNNVQLRLPTINNYYPYRFKLSNSGFNIRDIISKSYEEI